MILTEGERVQHNKVAERLWNRDLVLATVANFLFSLIFYLLMTTMALYAIERFGADDSVAGLASSMFIVGATVARLFAGSLTDLFGRRRVLIVSLAACVVVGVSYLPAGSLNLLVGIRFLHGLAFGVASTAVVAIAQSAIPPTRRGEGTGYFGVSATLGTALGPLLALHLVDGPGYPALFAASAVATALALAVALLLRKPQPSSDRTELAKLRLRREDMLASAVLPVGAFMLLMGIGYAAVLTFLNSYAQQLDLAAAASSYFLVYAVVVLVSRLVMGRIQDRHGDNVVVYPAIASFALGLLLLSQAGSTMAFVVAGGLIGFGFGTLMSAMQTAAVARVPAHRIGVAVSTFFFLLDIGTGLGPVLLGWLVQVTDHRTMYLVVGVVVAVSAGLYHVLHGRRRPVPPAVVIDLSAANAKPAVPVASHSAAAGNTGGQATVDVA